jgi:hypothetical protein
MIAAGEATLVGAVRARVDRDRAVAAFTSGVTGGVRRLIRGPLRSVAQIYLPFRLHEVTVRRGRRVERLLIGIDTVAGVLDLYRFDESPSPNALVNIPAPNHIQPLLPARAARDIVAARMQRVMYQRVGFLAIGGCRLDVEPVGDVVYVPYWLGFFGRGETASLVVIDAVRRQIEGAKARRLIERWITESAAP